MNLFGKVPLTYDSARLIIKVLSIFCLIYALFRAYTIRLIPIHLYGKLIHEFDPWFNYRASEYLDEHGWSAFFHWYDYMSWYPLGRPVGTTIYPGLQITSVAIRRALAMAGVSMTMNDVCCFIPAWFGAVSTLLAALLAYEATASCTVMAYTAYFFSILPAHLMRSMAGEYDNECIAMAAMLLTFYMWVRSLRSASSWPIGLLAGLAYGYMVSTWGGFIFVLNMVALHAAVCVFADWLRNTYDPSLLKAYSLFFVVGTAIATRVPPVGWTPFKSLEQLMALLVFIFMWTLHFSEVLRHRAGAPVRSTATLRIRARAFMVLFGLLVMCVMLLAPQGYFGPLSSRVRALFVQHTRTGNPLVDSVAEHRPASSSTFLRSLHICFPLWIIGLTSHVVFLEGRILSATSFLLLYSLSALYFSSRMSRLILLAGPVAALFSGIAVGHITEWAFKLLFWKNEDQKPTKKYLSTSRANEGAQKKKRKVEPKNMSPSELLQNVLNSWAPATRVGIAVLIFALVLFGPTGESFREMSHELAYSFANPRLMWYTRGHNDQDTILVDDYYVSYLWLRNNTPADARILAWWDYGYQITGIGNRTSLADGNTWNHEHIATIGKLLTSPVKEAHSLIRHLADYVLIWAGSRGDDLMKSPHMARIGNSVYRDICPEDDPLCSHFGFMGHDFSHPTPMMERSLLYNLHVSGDDPSKTIDGKMFRLAYRSRYRLVKIYKVVNVSAESKAWVADPKNRKCDAPGSWLCAGQYPPAKEIQDLIAKRIDYGQLEDFNRGKRDDAYYRAYMRRIRSEPH